jgi:hypothetical protein
MCTCSECVVIFFCAIVALFQRLSNDVIVLPKVRPNMTRGPHSASNESQTGHLPGSASPSSNWCYNVRWHPVNYVTMYLDPRFGTRAGRTQLPGLTGPSDCDTHDTITLHRSKNPWHIPWKNS